MLRLCVRWFDWLGLLKPAKVTHAGHSTASAAPEDMEALNWKCVVILCCLCCTSGLESQQLRLEDIERDTLINEKLQQPQQQPQQQQYFTSPSQGAPQQPQGPPEASTGPHQFAPDARQFPLPPPLQLQFPSQPQQQQHRFYLQPGQLQQQQHNQQFQFQFIPDNSLHQQDYFNLQNFFSSPSTPQYVYVQQPPNSIPVNNKQGGIEYVQYIDSNAQVLANPKTQAVLGNQHHKAAHNLAGLIQRNAYTNVLPLNYRQPAPQSYRVQGQPKPLINQNVYVVPPPQPQRIPPNHVYQPSNQVLSQQRFLIPQPPTPPPQYQLPIQFQQQNQFQQYQQSSQQQQSNQFQQPSVVYEQQPQQSTSNAVFEKREPQSLLDSYVPSALQIQYYKELQRQQNAVQEEVKASAGKTNAVKQQNDYQEQ